MKASESLLQAFGRLSLINDQWLMKRSFVKATRDESRQRFEGQKNIQKELSRCSSWSPFFRFGWRAGLMGD
jgi:hypothetical protein